VGRGPTWTVAASGVAVSGVAASTIGASLDAVEDCALRATEGSTAGSLYPQAARATAHVAIIFREPRDGFNLVAPKKCRIELLVNYGPGAGAGGGAGLGKVDAPGVGG
jgi:hypothetical protein